MVHSPHSTVVTKRNDLSIMVHPCAFWKGLSHWGYYHWRDGSLPTLNRSIFFLVKQEYKSAEFKTINQALNHSSLLKILAIHHFDFRYGIIEIFSYHPQPRDQKRLSTRKLFLTSNGRQFVNLRKNSSMETDSDFLHWALGNQSIRAQCVNCDLTPVVILNFEF